MSGPTSMGNLLQCISGDFSTLPLGKGVSKLLYITRRWLEGMEILIYDIPSVMGYLWDT